MGIPVISVDTKKKELIGLFANAGAIWANVSKRVNDHDFRSLTIAKAIPYGIYDLLFKHGFMCLGDSSDPAEFAVENLVRWWKNRMHPIFQCRPNRHSGRLWRLQWQPLPRLEILSANPPARCLSTTDHRVHDPAGASK